MSEQMLFCLGDGRCESKGEGFQKNNRIFNVDVSHEEWLKAIDSLPSIKIGITEWVNKEEMTADEKGEISGWETMGGFLRGLSFEEAWKKTWDNLTSLDKQKFLDLPNFNPQIFKAITGIDVEACQTNPKIIEIDNAKYQLIEE